MGGAGEGQVTYADLCSSVEPAGPVPLTMIGGPDDLIAVELREREVAHRCSHHSDQERVLAGEAGGQRLQADEVG